MFCNVSIFQKKILFLKNIVFIFLFKYIAQAFVVFKLLSFLLKLSCDFHEFLALTSSKHWATSKASCVLSAFMVFLLISWFSLLFLSWGWLWWWWWWSCHCGDGGFFFCDSSSFSFPCLSSSYSSTWFIFASPKKWCFFFQGI